MKRILVFDVNETLLDLAVLQPHFERLFGSAEAMGRWFAVLLHSSTVATLTDSDADFGVLAGAALDVVAASEGSPLPEADRAGILAAVRSLPPHPDVPGGLARLRDAGFSLAALTNSSTEMLKAQMKNAGLSIYFDSLLSVDRVGKFKPAPEVYRMAAAALRVEPGGLRLIAAHDWDVHGALREGWAGAFLARGGRGYHPLYRQPDITGPDLEAVARAIIEAGG